MQFSLQSLMLSFVVVAAAIGVCGPWGIALAAYLLLFAACVRRVLARSVPAVIVLTILFIVGLVVLLSIVVSFAREMDRREKCARNLRAISLESLTLEHEGRRAIVIPRDAKSAGCPVTVLNDVPAERRENSVIVFLPLKSQETEPERIPLQRVFEELELGSRSKLFEAQTVAKGPWYHSEGHVEVRLPDGNVRWLYGDYVRRHLDALLASASQPIELDQAGAFPARINGPWVASLVILIISFAVLILRPIPSAQPAKTPAL
jgi:hypothetical protein